MNHQLQQKRDQLYAEAEKAVKTEIRRAKREAEQIVEEIKEMKDSVNFKEHKWIEARKKLEEAEVSLVDEKEQTYENEQLVPLEVNDDVILKSIQQRGVILEKLSRSEEHTSELQSRGHLVCRLL